MNSIQTHIPSETDFFCAYIKKNHHAYSVIEQGLRYNDQNQTFRDFCTRCEAKRYAFRRNWIRSLIDAVLCFFFPARLNEWFGRVRWIIQQLLSSRATCHFVARDFVGALQSNKMHKFPAGNCPIFPLLPREEFTFHAIFQPASQFLPLWGNLMAGLFQRALLESFATLSPNSSPEDAFSQSRKSSITSMIYWKIFTSIEFVGAVECLQEN